MAEAMEGSDAQYHHPSRRFASKMDKKSSTLAVESTLEQQVRVWEKEVACMIKKKTMEEN